MRPTYESSNDLKNELDIIQALTKHLDRSFFKAKAYESIDFAMTNGKSVVGWVEVKRRFNNMEQYKTLAISAEKISRGKLKSISTGLPFYLAIGWDDFLGYLQIQQEDKFDIAIGGRSDRGDSADIEPMVHIPISMFTTI